jgi:hypothetical protein
VLTLFADDEASRDDWAKCIMALSLAARDANSETATSGAKLMASRHAAGIGDALDAESVDMPSRARTKAERKAQRHSMIITSSMTSSATSVSHAPTPLTTGFSLFGRNSSSPRAYVVVSLVCVCDCVRLLMLVHSASPVTAHSAPLSPIAESSLATSFAVAEIDNVFQMTDALDAHGDDVSARSASRDGKNAHKRTRTRGMQGSAAVFDCDDHNGCVAHRCSYNS